MARPKRAPGSAAERRVVGDLAYSELLTHALPILSPEDRALVQLTMESFSPSDIAAALCIEDAESRVAQASAALAQACRTVAAAQSLLTRQASSCRTFAGFAAEQRRVAAKKEAIRMHVEDSARAVRRFDPRWVMNDPWLFDGKPVPVTDPRFRAARHTAMSHFLFVRSTADQAVADLEQEDEEIIARAARHATTCPPCQLDVTRVLGRDWSPF